MAQSATTFRGVRTHAFKTYMALGRYLPELCSQALCDQERCNDPLVVMGGGLRAITSTSHCSSRGSAGTVLECAMPERCPVRCPYCCIQAAACEPYAAAFSVRNPARNAGRYLRSAPPRRPSACCACMMCTRSFQRPSMLSRQVVLILHSLFCTSCCACSTLS